MAHISRRFYGMEHIRKARLLKRQFGTRAAAGYLRNRNYSLEFALWVLVRTSERFDDLYC